MARFSVHRNRRGALLLNCQANILDNFSTRVVMPLLKASVSPPLFKRLNPTVTVEGEDYVLATHLLTSVPVSVLGEPVADLASEHHKIVDAIDMLITGF